MKYLVLTLLSLLFLSGCSSNKEMLNNYPRLKIQGEDGSLEYLQRTIKAELLYIQQDTLYLRVNGSKSLFYKTALSDLNKLTVDLYINKDWIAPVVVFEFIPATIFTIVGITVAGPGAAVLMVTYLPGITATALYIGGTPEKPVYDNRQLIAPNDLAKYCRYPKELTPDNFEKSFKHKLSEFKKLQEL